MSKRLSLIMDDGDEQLVAPYVTAGTPEHAALQQWAALRGDRVTRSEASALRILLRAGAEQLREDVLQAGYDELAAEWNAGHADDERRALRARYAAGTDAAFDE